MTKANMKEKVASWNKQITNLYLEKDNIFKRLQELNVEFGDGIRWLSVNKMMQALSCTDKYNIALDLLAEYNKLDGMNSALIMFLEETKNFDL